MAIIVTDSGFGPDDWAGGYIEYKSISAQTSPPFAIDVPSDLNPEKLRPFLDQTCLIRVEFPNFADGRGFTIARRLRLLKYQGRLRAKGHIIADQYAMARRCGFDEIEIDAALSTRQPEAQWLYRGDWQNNDYQKRLRANL